MSKEITALHCDVTQISFKVGERMIASFTESKAEGPMGLYLVYKAWDKVNNLLEVYPGHFYRATYG